MLLLQITRQATTTKSCENLLKDEKEVDLISKLKAQLRDQEKLVIFYFINKVREMQNVSMVFKSNFNYNHRVEHKKLL